MVSMLKLLPFTLATVLLGPALALAAGDGSEYEFQRCFDSRNSISYHSYKFGNAGVLSIMLDGVTKSVRVEETFSESRDSITTQIRDFLYVDASHVWVVSRLGHRFNAAVLLDLESLRIEREFKGVGFLLSPDRKRLAFAYPIGRDPTNLFIDGTMVFPAIAPDLIRVDGSVPYREADGFDITDFMRPIDDTVSIWAPLVWNGNTELEALIEYPNDYTYEGEALPDGGVLDLVVRLEDAPTSGSEGVSTSYRVLSRGDADNRRKAMQTVDRERQSARELPCSDHDSEDSPTTGSWRTEP